MVKFKLQHMLLAGALFTTGMLSCSESTENKSQSKSKDFEYQAESFADLQLLRYEVPGWDELSLEQKEFAYYLYEAALAGRDIIYDQMGKYNLQVRKILEAIWNTEDIDKNGEEWEAFKTYSGQVWFSNGIHHHYSNYKFKPGFSYEYFENLVKKAKPSDLPTLDGESIEDLLAVMKKVIFDETYMPMSQDTRPGIDHVLNAGINFYEGVTEEEVIAFYDGFPKSDMEPEWGLNSKVIKRDGEIVEKVWKSGGMYGEAIDKMIYWIEKAIPLAENEEQAEALRLLVKYYKSGDVNDWDTYNIAWVKDTASIIDFTSGFIEVYADPLGKKGSFETVLSMRDFESTARIQKISNEAQWFEDNSPLMEEHKKENVTGISAKGINVIVESGDAAPSTPIGINLPNSDWVRKEHGSKSVSLNNIINAYGANSASSGFLEEFVEDKAVLERMKKYGSLASNLHTDMHECIGHASGKLNPGVGTPDKTLRSYASPLEEARADLVALYYIMDQKLIDIDVMPSLEVGKAEYDSYMMNGLLTQYTRLSLGEDIQQAHMRNRSLNAYWAMEKGKEDNVVEFYEKNGKTYVRINDYEKLRAIFGEMLREIQRIKSEGDYEAGKHLIETYGVKVNQKRHKEILDRYASLGVKPYSGFIQPRLVPVKDKNGKITDVKLEYVNSFFDQMLEYGSKYSFLPIRN
ncbi:MAG TPA: hypothetical protein VK027_06690 [Chitinophagaceae bacterium]|nr:hypothetical protein [Chitinophagaceae bacterium]